MSNNPETPKIIFSMNRVGRIYPPGKQVLKDIHLSFFYGAKIGVLGLNGAGKSSVLKIIAGVDKDYSGEVHFSKEYSIGFLEQEPTLDPNKTVKEIVSEGVQEIVNLLKEYDQINAAFANPLSDDEMNKLIEKQARVQEKLDQTNAWELDSRLNLAMEALRCPPDDASIKNLSGGEKRRVALCRLLLKEPDILLLDEPTNHLDAESVFWLEKHLQQYKGTVIAVTHDRYFLDNVAGWILELDRGHGIPWKGNYSSWLKQKEERLRREEKSDQKRVKTLERELEWLNETPQARRTKSKARITNYENMFNQQQEKYNEEIEIYIPPGPRLGKLVIEAQNVSKAYGENLLFENLNFALPQGGIVGIIGPNGAGKTTLFRMIMGQEKPDAGTFKVGDTVKLGHLDQNRFAPEDKRTVWECISGESEIIKLGNREINSRAYVARFNFSGTDQQKSVSILSGGERNRVHLAMTLKDPGNVLLLDEPTNDLDVNTLRALETALENFVGCAVVISHDRWFLDRIATHILAFEGNSQVVWFEGNFSDYEEDKHRRLGSKADQLERIKYKKFKRD
ncbi:MAG: energy-dependent translational throttle protein EttA [Deltaproteobacteria bacterium RIFCSPLOWO2_12_FULL_40_28]|nr:MAG: energy-dependent translational throttle protein EttA [Deltaproteobacteria bacterium RIFCSPHIGHO2_02_FULL_40_28]OGQ19763.1 MAG: energy-dependent translational throttle protein EttA [Deltaproteobacteria bacterium RIFCSPHIGHO2_12_FULL_40_32]OGQ41040.1 MAG: energy-dependent translational throttle protein EttA [Deltaproteobacteria bacterium RIFCSPLOWO2_02_FULL_40_36]OGQ54156.1 MAG: energy-dependent translational throttle protein EttA [Deltaproteobacteria bacterium RIFCSPLOWO2_12_FULL_40_28]